MGLESISGLMDTLTQAIGQMIKKTAMVSSLGLMDESMRFVCTRNS